MDREKEVVQELIDQIGKREAKVREQLTSLQQFQEFKTAEEALNSAPEPISKKELE